MFYVINTNDTLSLYNDNKQIIDNTLELMPQLSGQPILETDYVTAIELSEHPNKMIVGDIEIPIEVPEYDEEGNPIMIDYEDTEVVIDYDEEGNPIGSHEITVIKHKQKTHTEVITVKGLIPNPNYEQEEEAKEAERINNLTMTPLDFIKVLESFGLTMVQINAFLESNLEMKMQLTYCNLVYCGVVKAFLVNPIEIAGVTITADMVEQAFKIKNGEE